MICCCFSVTKSYLTLCYPMDCSTPGFPLLHYLSEFAQIHVHCVYDAIQPSHSLLPTSPPAFNLSRIRSFPKGRLFTSGGQSIAISVSPLSLSNEYSGLISFRIGWFDFLAVQCSLKSLLQHHSSKASILQHSAFFMFQLLHLYMTTGKIIALTVGSLLTQ